MKFSRIVSWVTAAAGLALLLLACSKPKEVPTTIAPVTGNFVAAAPGWVDVLGGTRRLAAKADGIVAAVIPNTDAVVPAGTVLLRLDDRELQLQLQANTLELQRHQQAKQALINQLELAQQDIARLQALVNIQAEATDVLRQAQANAQALGNNLKAVDFASASSQLQRQQLSHQLEQLTLSTPSRGRLLRLDIHEGESVTRGMPLAWFAPEAPLIVRAELDERLLSHVQVGMLAEVESESGDGTIHAAKLVSIARSIGPVRALPEIHPSAKDDRVVECILTLDDASLLIGQRVTVRIHKAP